MSLEGVPQKREISEDEIERQRQNIKSEIADLRTHADSLESKIEELARNRAASGYNRGMRR